MLRPLMPSTAAKPAATGLYCELYWGANLSEAWSFGPELPRVLAAPDEAAPLPLYGFRLPEEPFVLAEHVEGRYRVYPTPAMRVERRRKGEPFTPAEPTQAARPYVTLGEGEVLRLSEGELSLHVHPSLVRERVRGMRVRDGVMLAAGLLLFLSLPVGFLAFGPDPARQMELAQRMLAVQREKEEAKREELGVTSPARELTEAERQALQQPDGGSTVVLPMRLRVD
jgi:hypothetical protein